MLVSVLALSGVPPFSGFWSKDAILATTWEAGQFWLFLIAAVTAMLTFIYSLKIVGSVFLGPKSAHIKELEQEGSIIHEASPLMYIPYVLLAAVTIVIGVAGPIVEQALSEFLSRGLGLASVTSGKVAAANLQYVSPEVAVAFTTVVVLLSGGAIGYVLYISRRIDPSKFLQNSLLRSVHGFLWNRLYVNPVYYIGFVKGTLALSGSLSHWVESGFFGRINEAVSQLSVGLSKSGDRFDLGVVDGAVNGVATTGKRFSGVVAKLQTGVAQQYLLVFAFGVFLIVLALTFLGK